MSLLYAVCRVVAIWFLLLTVPIHVSAEEEVPFSSSPSIQPGSSSGVALVSIPIEIPPGRRGINPSLALQFNSFNNKNGWIGLGWDLPISYIQRNTRHGLNYNNNDFVHDGAAELVARGDWGTNYYGNKIEGSFSKYYYNSSTGGWEVTSKDGSKYFYGTTASSRQDNSYGVFKWFVERVEDTNGNYMTFQYFKDQGEVYIDRINYTGNSNAPSATTHYLKFYWEGRSDTPRSYTSHSNVVTAKRLKVIHIVDMTRQVRLYDLNYSTSVDISRSLLSSVSEYGTDASFDPNTLTITGAPLKTVVAGWPQFTGSLVNNSEFSAMPDVLAVSTQPSTNAGRRLIDLNNDGRPDYMKSIKVNGVTYKSVYLNTGTGWQYHAGFSDMPTDMILAVDSESDTNSGRQFADMNGDGLIDFIVSISRNGTVVKKIFINTGAGWVLEASGLNNIPALLAVSGQMTVNYGRRLIDMNGDGLPDIVRSFEIDGAIYKDVYLNSGNGWERHAGLSDMPFVLAWETDGGLRNGGRRLVDLNGDGLPDLVFSQSLYPNAGDGDYRAVYLNTGTGWQYHAGLSAIPALLVESINGNDKGRLLIDMNGDGLNDFVLSISRNKGYYIAKEVYLNTGNGWIYDVGLSDMPTVLDVQNSLAYPDFMDAESLGTTNLGRRLIDMNGDGLPDLIRSLYRDGIYYKDIWLNTGSSWVRNDSLSDMPELLAIEGQQSTNSGRQLIDLDGDGLLDFVKSINAGSDNIGVYINNGEISNKVNSVSNGFGATTTLTYASSSSYVNTLMPYIVQTLSSVSVNDGIGNVITTNYTYSGGLYDFVDREFRGFNSVKSTDPIGTTTETLFHQDSIKKGLPYRQETKNSAGLIYSRVDNAYDPVSPYAGVNFPKLASRDEYICDGTTVIDSCKKSTVSFTYNDSYGNITRKYMYGDTAVTGDEIDEYTEYTYDTVKWIVDRPSHTYLLEGSVKRGEAWFTYYPNNGNLLTHKKWLNGGINPVVTYGYDVWGNRTSITDPKGKISTTTYDSAYHTYPSVKTNAFGQTISLSFDTGFGKILLETDSNGNNTTYENDQFGRPIKVVNPNDATSTYGTVTYSYLNFGNPVNQKIVEYRTKNSGTSDYIWKETYFDGLGRTIKARKQGPDGKTIVQQTTFNTRGLTEKETLPYFENEAAREINYAYDAIGRPTLVTNPDSTTVQMSYDKGRITSIDPNGHKKVQEKDVYGRLVKVEEHTGSGGNYTRYATTNYKYDALGNLIRTTDALGNQINISYDTFGRKTSMTDPDMGKWDYFYDANGNLVEQVDATSEQMTNGGFDSGVSNWGFWVNTGTEQNPIAAATFGTLEMIKNGSFESGASDWRLTVEAGASAIFGTPDQMTNGGFESGISNWGFWVDTPAGASATFDIPEQITNGGFESGITGWSFWVNQNPPENPIAIATFATSTNLPYQGDNSGLINIVTGGPNYSDIQLAQGSRSIQDGKVYTITFAAKATANRPIIVSLIKAGAPSTPYAGDQTVNLTTSWQVFTLRFTANTTASDAKLNMSLGHDSASIFIDAVSWTEGTAAAPYQGANSGFINISDGGSTTSKIQLVHANHSIESGKTYIVSFAAKATANRTIDVGLIKQTDPFTWYTQEGNRIVNLTTDWQVFNLSFTANTTATDARLNILLGGNNASVYFDAVSWTEAVGAAPGQGVNSGYINITAGGSSNSNIQLVQGPRTIQSGKVYKVSFYAKAAATRTIVIRVIKDGSPWTWYADEQTVTLTNAWNLYTLYFTANATATDARLNFYLGGDGTSQGGGASIHIDAVSWTENSGTTAYSGANSAFVSIASGGPADSDIQLVHGNHTIQNGRVYFISFMAKAAAERSILVGMVKNAAPFTVYAEQQVVYLTTEWETYILFFTANATASDARLNILLGGNDLARGNGASVYFDAVSFKEMARGIIFEYDDLNRVTLKNYPTGTDVTYTYDEAWSTNAKGRLTTMVDASGTTKFYYDKLGNITRSIRTIDGVDYTIETTYDALGRTTSVKYPDGEIVSYTYDAAGNLATAGPYATYSGYNALGQSANINYGNGTATSYQYSPTNNRLSSITTSKDAVNYLALSYAYDNNGNITAINDSLSSSRNQTFTYDDLNRLTRAQSSSYGFRDYSYNQIGNMLSKEGVIYTYGGARPHAVTATSDGKSYTYDANGNMVTDGQRTITYNYDNLPSVVTNTVTTTFVYDGNGHRVKKVSPTNTTIYVSKIYECVNGACSKYIFAKDTRIALKNATQTLYYHQNHLNSSSIVTNAAGAIVEEIYYRPYGAAWSDTGSVNINHKYTSQEYDSETGLYYYGARYYNPQLGRFISPDTIVPDPAEPQALNRYSYTLNNPLIYTDPTGNEYEGFYLDPDYGYDGSNYFYSNFSNYSFIDSYSSSTWDLGNLWNNESSFFNQSEYPDLKSYMGPGITDYLSDLWQNTGRPFMQDRASEAFNRGDYFEWGADKFAIAVFDVTDLFIPKSGDLPFTSMSGTLRGSNAVIGKLPDLKNLLSHEQTLIKHLPDLSSPKANWYQNSSVLRIEMSKGMPIRDASIDPLTKKLRDETGFLRAERELLRNHGWQYDNGFWFSRGKNAN